MTNLEASALLVLMYADYQHKSGDNVDYAEAVAMAISALTKSNLEE